MADSLDRPISHGMLRVALEHLVFAQGLLAQVPNDVDGARRDLAEAVWQVRKAVQRDDETRTR